MHFGRGICRPALLREEHGPEDRDDRGGEAAYAADHDDRLLVHFGCHAADLRQRSLCYGPQYYGYGLVGGMLLATMLGIFIYPALYYLVARVGKFERKRELKQKES